MSERYNLKVYGIKERARQQAARASVNIDGEDQERYIYIYQL